MTKWVRAVVFGSCAGVLLITAVAAQQRDSGKPGEWGFYGGDARATKYSPLDQINADNVKQLRKVAKSSTTRSVVLQTGC